MKNSNFNGIPAVMAIHPLHPGKDKGNELVLTMGTVHVFSCYHAYAYFQSSLLEEKKERKN